MTAQQNYRVASFVSDKAIKAPCQAISIANLTLFGEQTVNAVPVLVGDRVLVNAQTVPAENGIYDVELTTWVRSADWNGERDATNGTIVIVAGTALVSLYQLDVTGTFTIGTSNATFTLMSTLNLAGELASTATGEGASQVAIEDAAGNFTAANVEAALAEIIADFAAVTTGDGASKISIEDAGALIVATNVEGALAEIAAATATLVASDAATQIKVKTADESVTSSITLQDDNHLTGFAIAQNSRYAITGFLDYDQNIGDLRLAFQYTVSPGKRHYQVHAVAENGTTDDDTDNSGVDLLITAVTDAQNASAFISGMVTFGAVGSGTGKLTWAQGTSSANATTLKEGSWLKFEKI